MPLNPYPKGYTTKVLTFANHNPSKYDITGEGDIQSIGADQGMRAVPAVPPGASAGKAAAGHSPGVVEALRVAGRTPAVADLRMVVADLHTAVRTVVAGVADRRNHLVAGSLGLGVPEEVLQSCPFQAEPSSFRPSNRNWSQ
jgi:malonyl CoA-acyl carrier protein transacylase